MVNKATLGGGCFWCIEAVFQLVKGVDKVVSGYSGGHTDNPSYDKMHIIDTGHAEVIQIDFDNSTMGCGRDYFDLACD